MADETTAAGAEEQPKATKAARVTQHPAGVTQQERKQYSPKAAQRQVDPETGVPVGEQGKEG